MWRPSRSRYLPYHYDSETCATIVLKYGLIVWRFFVFGFTGSFAIAGVLDSLVDAFEHCKNLVKLSCIV